MQLITVDQRKAARRIADETINAIEMDLYAVHGRVGDGPDDVVNHDYKQMLILVIVYLNEHKGN